MDKNVHNAFLKFSQLLFTYGLSSHKDEKLSIKIEIDINPPKGGKTGIMLYKYIFMFYIQHYDLRSLFAGKLHALLCREYTKGRDWYDLLWYLTNCRGLEPNYEMLNNAIRQTEKDVFKITEKNWKDLLKEKISYLDVNKVKDDVSRFLEDPDEIELLTRDNLIRLLR